MKMIGFYDYTVVLTYISLGISIFGMMLAFNGNPFAAILCLVLSGICDMFDGKIARTKKNRTDDEKLFGIQIDSLCDVICFGILPIIICFFMGMRDLVSMAILVYYGICSVIRLGYFNVLETNRQKVESGVNKVYHGLPITSIAIILPIASALCMILRERAFSVVLMITMLATGSLFITDFELKKPSNRVCAIMVAAAGCFLIAFLVIAKTRTFMLFGGQGMLLSNRIK